jgi:hypothetical protein
MFRSAASRYGPLMTLGRFTSRMRGIAAVAGASGAVLLLLVACPARADQPTSAPQCALRLSVEVTPDVPNPTDPGFISSLLGDNVGYQLFLVQRVDDTHVNLQLQGPGEKSNCRAVVKSMREDGRISSIQEI